MNSADFEEETALLNRLRNKEIEAFKILDNDYSEDLLLFAYTIVNDPVLTNLAVEKLFIELWENDPFVGVEPPITHFLYAELRRLIKAW